MSQIGSYRLTDPSITLTGDTGGIISPDVLDNIDILGGTNINTVGTLNTMTFNLDDAITLTTVNATTFDTNVVAAGVTLSGTSLVADGTDADIDINITAKGTGQVVVDDLQITDLTAGTLRVDGAGNVTALADGANGTLLIGKSGDVPIWATLTDGNNITATVGANDISLAVTGTTDHAVQIGNATGSLTSLAVGATGTILQGNSAADPTWSTATYPSTVAIGDILVASAANVITSIVPATATYVLTANGAGAAPTFQANPTGTVTSVSGGTNITASGTASDPIMDLDATITLTTVNATTFDTNVVAAGVTLSGTSLLADGTDANIDINLTAKGTGVVIIDELELTDPLAVTEGGTGADTFTDHGVLVGSTTAAFTPLAVGTNGQVLLGSSAADPVFGTLTSTGTIAFTPGAGSLAIDARAATDSLTGVVELATDAEAIAGSASTVVNCVSLKAKLGTQTSHGIAYGATTTGALAYTAEMSDGQLLIGDTSGVPIPATLTEGTGISVTNAAGSVTVATTGTTIVAETGTTYEFLLSDIGKVVTFDNASAITVTVPVNADVAIPVGSMIGWIQKGAGVVTFTPEGGVTIRSEGTLLSSNGQYSAGLLIKTETNVWNLSGNRN